MRVSPKPVQSFPVVIETQMSRGRDVGSLYGQVIRGFKDPSTSEQVSSRDRVGYG